ncbi:Protein of uncharacterised function (DUF2612) [Urinicoccus massiliensis]|uniref:Protein of uncharacterized function (DUF2612) n=1 Tax=Urinicoccus massiliensis TaxID=1723382 RepID=A0A8H2R223_9FIRM|nr:hypothetical protein [Urinicoccus massiliensis]VFB17188.1 Protein of uncharacterised function (DUF2612) [Urinicoccus massiliensis]
MYHDQEALYYKAWRRLPERFRKPNNLDLYYVLYGGYGEIEAGFQGIKNSRDIDQATGETLDRLGENVGQFRLGEEDDLYRLLIKTRVIANMSIGDIPTINYVMSVLLKEVFLGLEETWPYEDYLREPAAIKLKLGPLAGSIPYEIIDRIKAAGVRVLIELNYRHDLKVGSGMVAGEMITIAPPKPGDIKDDLPYKLGASIYTEYEEVTIGRSD